MSSGNTFRFGKEFVRGEITLGAWSYVKKGVGFLDAFFILKSLTLYQLGVYQLLLSVYAIISDVVHDLFASVVGNDLARFVGSGEEGRAKRLFREYSIFRILIACLPALGLLLLLFLPDRYGFEVKLWFILLAATLVADAVVSLFLSLLGLRLEYGAVASRPTIQKSVEAVLLAYFFFFADLGITQILLTRLLAPILTISFFVPAIRRSLLPWRRVTAVSSPTFLPIIRSYGKWEVPQLLFKDLVGKVRPWIIKIFLNVEYVGVFSVANTAVSMLRDLIPARTLSGLLPRAAHDEKNLERLFLYGTKYFSLLSLLLAAAGGLMYPPLMILVFPHLSDSIPLFYILLPTLLIFAFTKFMNILLVTMRRQDLVFYSSVAYNACTLGFVAVFLKTLGAAGLAWGETVGYALSTALKYWYLVRVKFIPRFPWRGLLSFGDEDRLIFAEGKKHLLFFLKRFLPR